MERKDEIIGWLNSEEILYKYIDHPPVFTMEDITIHISDGADICKNLFLRDHPGKMHCLVVVYGDKRVDLRALSGQVGSRLSFASDKRLQKYLNMETGEVGPMGLYYDKNHEVRVLLDSELQGKDQLGFHPCDRASTVVMPFTELEKLVERLGNSMQFIEISNNK